MRKSVRLLLILILCVIICPEIIYSQQKFYEYYEKGLNYASSQDWQSAADMFKKAIEIDAKDSYRKRVYGTKFIEYFPNRELGIAYAYLKQDGLARQYLDISLGEVYSERAEDFKNRVGNPSLLTAVEPKKEEPQKAAGKTVLFQRLHY